jgi:preprotein translocase subunit SecG
MRPRSPVPEKVSPMITALYVLYVMVCLFLILVVLLQAGRGGMGAAFGGSSQTVFGGSGAGNFLTKLTVISAALFMMLSAVLTYVSSSGEKSLDNASERVRQREEARSGGAKGGPKDAKGAAATAPDSTSTEKPAAETQAAPPANAEEAAPVEMAPKPDSENSPAAPGNR